MRCNGLGFNTMKHLAVFLMLTVMTMAIAACAISEQEIDGTSYGNDRNTFNRGHDGGGGDRGGRN